ncbi:helix-turn-helix domain-containing protein [Pirellulales bacterium]|jgi:hypothetical protein|nr:helix-turn-helix domain-containing protein [Pirellulales bacterium]
MTSSIKLLTSIQVAEWLQVKPQTLATWRAHRTGPDFVRVSSARRSIRYERDAVQAWIDSQRVVCTE